MAGQSVYFKDLQRIDNEARTLGITRSEFIQLCVDDYFTCKKYGVIHRMKTSYVEIMIGVLFVIEIMNLAVSL